MGDCDAGAFDNFSPRAYLEKYYASVDQENAALLRFLAEVEHSGVCNGADVLDFGSGPALYGVVSFARSCKTIAFADPVESNRREISHWIEERPTAFNWQVFIEEAVRLEERLRGSEPTEKELEQLALDRSQKVRRMTQELLACDARSVPPLKETAALFDLVLSSFCLEHVASSAEEFANLLGNVVSLVRPGGCMVLISLVNGRGIEVAGDFFPVVDLKADEVSEAIERAGLERVKAQEFRASGYEYKGFIMLLGRLRAG